MELHKDGIPHIKMTWEKKQNFDKEPTDKSAHEAMIIHRNK